MQAAKTGKISTPSMDTKLLCLNLFYQKKKADVKKESYHDKTKLN